MKNIAEKEKQRLKELHFMKCPKGGWTQWVKRGYPTDKGEIKTGRKEISDP